MKFVELLRRWFLHNRRELPWREDPSPYAVWVSEVMLQQTRVAVVIPYFMRWMERWPTVASLAEAKLEEVIKLWEGLGYYSRARNLHEGAREVVKSYGGVLPDNLEELVKIKGIGAYTAGAILSFAFHKRAVALDANVLRVMARYSLFEQEVSKGYKELQKRVYDFLPEKEPHVVMEALIELGALVCQKKPKCAACPLFEGCLARQKGVQGVVPLLKKKEETVVLHRVVACIEKEGAFLLKKNERGKVMADLWEFPFVEKGEEIQELLQMKLLSKKSLSVEKHSFTRYRVFLYPTHFITQDKEPSGYEWVAREEFTRIPFSSGHLRISRQLLKNKE